MDLNLKLDLSKAGKQLQEAAKVVSGNCTEAEESKHVQDSISDDEWRFRIKTLSGSDINIPSSVAGTMLVVMCSCFAFSATLKFLGSILDVKK